MRSIYLDFGSTTPVAASVRDSMLPFLSEFYGHPSSSHWFGRAAQEALEDSRSSLSCLLGSHPSEIVFTSGGTESVNLAILGAATNVERIKPNEPHHIITTILEHACVLRTIEHLARRGWEVTLIGCDASGLVQVDEFQAAVRPHTRLASVIHASHLLGTIQPIAKISEICQIEDIVLHTDAAQSVGKIECLVDELGVDLLSFSGHKFYAPKGVGGLYVRFGVDLDPIMCGDGNESGLRPGTENVPHIVALGQAAKLVQSGAESSGNRLAEMCELFHTQLEKTLGQPIRILGQQAPRLPQMLTLLIPGVPAQALQHRIPEICFGQLERANIKLGQQPVQSIHNSLGLTEQQASELIRVSIGWTTSEEELRQAVQLIGAACDSLR